MSVVEDILLNPNEDKVKKLNELIKKGEIDFNIVEERILDSNNAKLLYLAGINIEWINLGRLSHALVRTKNSFYILRFAWFINKLENSKQKENIIKDLANGVIRSKVAYNIYYFARDIKGAPVDKLALALAKSNDSTYIYYTIRDLYSRVSISTRIELAHRIIALKKAGDILSISNIVKEISLIEYANGMLNAKKDEIYGVHLTMFMGEHELPEGEISTSFITALLVSKDYRRIVGLILESDNVPYQQMIDYILTDETNYQNSDFWLEYIFPLAVSNKECASYAVDKIIESDNIEIISITIHYLKDGELKQRLQSAVKNANIKNQELKKVRTKAKTKKHKI